jgi:hypothetical protein
VQYRDYLVTWLADGVRGSADLVAYFYLRAAGLLRIGGGFGLIATNTLAQGETREVGLDRLGDGGTVVYRAISSEPWPGGANLEMATVWARRDRWDGANVLDRTEVTGITSALTLRSRVAGNALRLYGARHRAFTGSTVLGKGFVLSPEEAERMLRDDPRNVEVVRPYLIGKDLNQRPDATPSRWVIDFRDWPEERAREYVAPFARVAQLVLPERERNNRELYRRRWWQFGERRPGLYRAIKTLTTCIVVTQVSNVLQPVSVPGDIVLDQQVVVFAYDDDGHFGLLSSGFHWWWAVSRASTMRTDIRYTPTDCFETFAQPELTSAVGDLGGTLNAHRTALMLDRQEGLTKTYNRVHDPEESSDDIARLRELHVALDHAVGDAYGLTDLDLGRDFHETKFGTRFTFAPVARQEVLDLLLELNHERYAAEVRQGLHDKPKTTKRKPTPAGAMTFGFGDV